MRRLAAVALVVTVLMLGASAEASATTRTVRCNRGADLQAAIDRAQPGDTLVIKGTCRGDFVIEKDLVLAGEGPSPTLRGAGPGPTLFVPPARFPCPCPQGATVRLQDLTVTGAGSHGIETWGTFVLRDSTVRGNAGDGIAHQEHGDVLVRGSSVRGNGGTGVSHGSAGGSTSIVVDDSVIADNGGGGVLASSADVRVEGSILRDNAGRGLGVGVQQLILVLDTRIARNRDGGVSGGASSYMELRRTEVLGNRTIGDGGGIEWSAIDGHTLTIRDSVIADNTATGDGGGIHNTAAASGRNQGLVIIDSTIARNLAGGEGGGVHTAIGAVLVGVRFRDNAPNDCTGC